MSNEIGHMDVLISKVLSNEASAEEIQTLNNWISLSELNAAEFEASKKLYAAVENTDAADDVNVDAAWQKVQAKINEPVAKIIPLYRKKFFKMAAAVILLSGLFILSRQYLGFGAEEVEVAAFDGNVFSELPDGSKVLVNKNSSVVYKVIGKKRSVKLKGEAFFEVVHKPDEIFEVEVGDVLVKDIGTKFSVREDVDGKTIEVKVEEGEVQFYSSDSEGLRLVAGETGLYNKSSQSFKKVGIENSKAVTTTLKVFEFEGSKLKDVIAQLNTAYDSKIVLENESMGECTLSVSFIDEDLNVILSVISETLDLEVKKEKDRIVLAGGPCQP